MITVDPDLAAQVRVARVGQIWRRSRWAVFLYVLIFVPLGLGTTLSVDHPTLFAGMIALFIIAGIVRWKTLLLERPPDDPAAASRWLRSYGVQSMLSGLLWGSFACYMQVYYRGVFLQFAVLLISAGISCFSLGAFAGDRKLTLSFLCSTMVPTFVGLGMGGDGEAVVLMALMLLFLSAVIYQIFELNKWFTRSTVESLMLEKSRQDAEAAARVKSEFLANMSHELRTPMNGVMGMLELLLQGNLDREQKMLAQTSHRSAEALLDILNDVLDFSKMSAGKLDFAVRDLQLRAVVEDVYDLLGPRAIEKGLDLGYRLDPNVPEWVLGDEGRLRQVLVNLVSNAVKFSYSAEWPNGGSVFIEVTALPATPDAVRLRFTVADQGPGMTAETLAKLFQPFMQADTSTSRRFGGTGLGLAISRQLVEAMGGAISAESQPGSGAKFSFEIQLLPSTHSATITRPTTACQILVIEPAPLSLSTIGRLIRRHGATAVCAATLDEAARHLSGTSFQAVIAGASPVLPPALLLARLQPLLPVPPPLVFLLLNRGESLEAPLFAHPLTLTRPVRLAQVAELLVAAACMPRSTVPAPVVAPARLAGHVLIAEDNAVNQVLAQRLLAAIGLTAEVVPDGNAALEALATGRFKLVLMDCQMPGLDGYETTRRLRQLPATTDLPVVAMTANAMKGDRELCLAAGMDDYVSKPIRLDRLREVLSRYLPAAHTVPDQEGSK